MHARTEAKQIAAPQQRVVCQGPRLGAGVQQPLRLRLVLKRVRAHEAMPGR